MRRRSASSTPGPHGPLRRRRCSVRRAPANRISQAYGPTARARRPSKRPCLLKACSPSANRLSSRNADQAPLAPEAETALFALLERGQSLLLDPAVSGRPPGRCALARSRFAFRRPSSPSPLWAPDDGAVGGVGAQAVRADRQASSVGPKRWWSRWCVRFERSPAARSAIFVRSAPIVRRSGPEAPD